MLPSVCAATLRGCTAMPASIAAQKLWTLILPVARSTETSATPAASVSSFTMVPMPSAAPVALALSSPTSRRPSAADAAMRGAPAVSSSRNATGSLPRSLRDLVEEALDREGVVAVADAAQCGDSRAPRSLDDVLGELVRDPDIAEPASPS